MGIILGVLRLEASVYNVYITKQFQTTLLLGVNGGGGGNPLVDFCPNYVQEFALSSAEANT